MTSTRPKCLSPIFYQPKTAGLDFSTGCAPILDQLGRRFGKTAFNSGAAGPARPETKTPRLTSAPAATTEPTLPKRPSGVIENVRAFTSPTVRQRRSGSELKLLRWSDIKWEQNRFVVQSLKTEHHARHRERTVPLFSELRHELERHFSSEKAKGNEFVIQGFQGTTWGLYNQFQAISRDAGLGTIVRPFDNMRMSSRMLSPHAFLLLIVPVSRSKILSGMPWIRSTVKSSLNYRSMSTTFLVFITSIPQ